MIYPIYIHPGDDQHAHGITLPDFPGCFSASDSWQGLPAAVQEAVEVWFEGDATDIPQPSDLDQLTQDATYQGGFWMLIDINTETLTRPVHQTEAEYNPFDHLLADSDLPEYLAEAYEDEDPAVFVIALGHAVKHRGVAQVAEASGLNRESLYKVINGKVQPKWDTIHKIMRALGVHLRIAA